MARKIKRKQYKFLLMDIEKGEDYWIQGEPDKKILLVDMTTYDAETFEWLNKKPSTGTPAQVEKKKYIDGQKLTSIALDWNGKDFRPGQTEQCCYFVRQCLKQAGITAGITAKPSDGLTTSEGYASSLAGDDIGLKVEKKDLLPGDLLFFKNTYGDWPEGTITHIGIYTGNGYFIHRPTASRPVEKADLENYGHFREGRRLYNK